jgi:SAM-dependent methyltransferase
MKILKIIENLRNTGERPLLNTWFEDIDPVLQFAYKFAGEKIVKNDTVLDYGCGGGYGTEYLSRITEKKVVGYDIAQYVIAIDRQFFINRKNLNFFSESSCIENKYDLVVSFQVIEHLSLVAVDNYLTHLKKYLKDDGLLIISTVNKNTTSHNLKKPIMPFHIHEYYPQELLLLLKNYFSHVDCFGQIDKDSLDKFKAGKWSYRNDLLEGKNKFLRFISQIELVRLVARFTPLSIKSILFGYNKNNNFAQKYILTRDEREIDNSYILIYECRL